jgi:hypothetical protein
VKLWEVVIIGSDHAHELSRPLAQLIPGTDGVVHLKRLKMATGESLKPIQRLYPLEVGDDYKMLRNLTDGFCDIPQVLCWAQHRNKPEGGD